jgi:hypothetical protein
MFLTMKNVASVSCKADLDFKKKLSLFYYDVAEVFPIKEAIKEIMLSFII